MIAIQKLKGLRLFQRPDDVETSWQIILWWEIRRVAFNLIVGLTGFLTCLLLVGIAWFSEKKFGEAIGLPDPPIVAVFAIFFYGIAANIFYTAGWILEIFAKHIWQERLRNFGAVAFAAGIIFSVALTLLPVVICSLAVVVKLLLPH